MKPTRLSAPLVRLGSLLALGSLSACSVLPRPEPPTVYRLPPPATAPVIAQAAPQAWSLQVATPLASAAINRSAITVMPRPDRVNNYRGARWSDPAPILFRDAVVRRLQQRYPGTVITSDDSDLSTRYTLVGRLDAFQSEYRDGAPRIVIHYDGQLLTRETQAAIAVHGFEVSVRPASAQVSDIVAAFGQAMQQLQAQLQPWLSLAVEQARTAPRSPSRQP